MARQLHTQERTSPRIGSGGSGLGAWPAVRPRIGHARRLLMGRKVCAPAAAVRDHGFYHPVTAAPQPIGRGVAPALHQDDELLLPHAQLSAADRAVLALARAAASLSNKAQAERAASSHGLTIVTNSEVCVSPGPLLAPYGSTVDEDGEEGDGMALASPFDRTPQQNGAGSLLSAVFAARAAAPPAPGAFPLPAGSSHSSERSFELSGLSRAAPAAAAAQLGSAGYAHMVSEGGGGDDEDGGSQGAHAGGERASRQAPAAAEAKGGRGVTLMAVAAAALTEVAKAATTAAEAQAPVGRAAAAASAAAHVAQAAVASAAKATAQMLPQYGEPASSWLVADDPRGSVRYIVIAAGPDLRKRTQQELAADLVTFEAYSLGVKVNRRLYGEATALYSRFLPIMMDYLEAVPHGHICFGGQGVGGGLAVLLQLMCCHRGLRYARLLPAVAVDAPAVVGQVPLDQRRIWGPTSKEQQHLHTDRVEDVLEELLARSVLEELGLPQDAVRNIALSPPQQQQQQQQQQAGGGARWGQRLVEAGGGLAAAPLVLVGATEGGRGGGGRSGSADPSSAQVFRLVGKVVNTDTGGSAASGSSAAASAPSLAPAAGVAGGFVETDGGSGEVAAAAAAAKSGAGDGSRRRLDVAMVGSFAAAAATAAAATAGERLRLMGAGALRAAAVGRASSASAVAAATASANAAAAAAGARLELAAVPTARAVGPLVAAAVAVRPWAAAGGGFGGADSDEDEAAWGV